MIAASTGGTTVIAAFAVGFASFVSPCVLPLVPGYLSVISGVQVKELQSGERRLGQVLWPSIIFCLSFTFIFVALGMAATSLGSTLSSHRLLLDKIAGVTIILLGVYFVSTPFVLRLNKEWHPEGLMVRATGGPLIAGAAFAVAWTPCVGPTLASILAAAAVADSVGRGGVLLAFYSLGLAVPFLLCAVAFNKATTAFKWLRDHYVVVNTISGVILIGMGVLLTGELTALNNNARIVLEKLHLDFVYSL